MNKYIEKFRETHPNYAKEYYEKNKDKIYEQQTKYRKANSKKVSKLAQDSRKRRVEKLKEQGCTNPWYVVLKGAEPKFDNK